MDLLQILRYWRTSLADGVLGEGKLSQRDRKRFVSVSSEALRTGKLQDKDLSRVFKNQPSAKSVAIRFWPLVMARKSSHGAMYADGLPEIVAPVVTEATVDRDGQIIPSRNALARDVLAPLPSGEFSIGTVEELDAFLTETPLPDMTAEGSWQDYLGHCRKMVDAVAEGWPRGDKDYQPVGSGFLELAEDASAMVRNIIDLYDKLLAEKPDTPLLTQTALPRTAGATPDPRIERDFDRRLGHSNPHFPLSEHQRQVLAYLDASSPGEVIAVNGPPGTGKTTILLSAVASAWIRAALKGEDPPVIVAASANNQAVTNIIDAFGKDFARGDGPIAGRWLPEVESFGIFLASHTRKLEAARKYQTEDFQTERETVEYFTRAKEAYLQAARVAFPSLLGTGVEAVVNAVQQEMAAEARKLTDLDLAAKQLEEARNAVHITLGENPGAAEADLTETATARQYYEAQFKAAKTALEAYVASESTLVALFSFLPAIKRKRALRARIAIREFMPGTESLNSVADIEARVREELHSAKQKRIKADQELAQAQRLRRVLAEAEGRWKDAVGNIGGSAELSELERRADLGIRFKLFLLATHYWEGRWLLAMEADLADIVASHSKNGKATVVPRWRRRMMLTPCAVATFATLPGKLAYTRRDGDKWATEYLYNFIDLLIVDEAAQVLPQVAGASLSLAKRALVIGDTQQIEPISSVPKPVDIANLRNCGLLQGDEDWESLSARGLSTTTGSAMRLAQEACQISPYNELEKGLYLFEHRRCYDDIIGYCNALCYKGKLRPLRGRASSGCQASGSGLSARRWPCSIDG